MPWRCDGTHGIIISDTDKTIEQSTFVIQPLQTFAKKIVTDAFINGFKIFIVTFITSLTTTERVEPSQPPLIFTIPGSEQRERTTTVDRNPTRTKTACDLMRRVMTTGRVSVKVGIRVSRVRARVSF